MSKETLTVEQASALWDSLRDAFTNLHDAIRRTIEAKAWRPLGYETFTQAWDDRMKGMPLANAVKPYVIYAMLDEGQSIEDITGATNWGADQVGRAAEDYRYGIPPEGATVVRRHFRRAPGAPSRVHIEFPAHEYERIAGIATAQGRDVAAEARAAVLAHFERLEQHPRTRRAS